MSFTQAIGSCFRQYVGFSGRATRSEYWWFFLFSLIATFVAAAAGTSVYAIVILGLFLPGLAVTVRRLHDTGRSGWWILISLVPLLGVIVLLVFLVSAGEPAENRFGPAGADGKGMPVGGPVSAPPIVTDRIACPRCGESIAASATVCRFCSYELATA